MYAMLGFTMFELLDGFTADSSEHPSDFAVHDVLAGKPRLQAMGNGLDERSLSIQLHHHISDPDAAFRSLVSAKNLQRPLPLVFGNGDFAGLFVITNIANKTLFTAGDGKVLARQCDIELLEWASDAMSLLALLNPLSPVGLAAGGLPVGAVGQSITTALSTGASLVLAAVATYSQVKHVAAQLTAGLAAGEDVADTGAALNQHFVDLSQATTASYATAWSADWLTAGLGDDLHDFTRFNAQAANQYATTFPAIVAGNADSASAGMDSVSATLAAAQQPAEKITAWVSMRGAVDG